MKMKVYSVGQVNNYIKNIISQDYVLKKLTIQGEVSNCKYHSLGHIYFSLKDETGSIAAVMFKGSIPTGLKFRLADGQNVLVTGRIGVYERDGKYQLYAEEIKQDGVGNLYEEFEKLKLRLNEEGLFDFEKKKDIPKFPKKIGIVTARTGAAIQDIMNIARRRNPYVQLVLYPAKVQGEGAADTIVRGIKTLDKLGLDTIIIGRGGGSIEDLWAFNEEKVVRAVYEANTPIISGTGHEVDITLADYAADMRAPTPSAACELAIPDVMTTVNELRNYERLINNHISSRLSLYNSMLEKYESKLNLLNPRQRLENQNQYLSELYDRLKKNIENKYNHTFHRFEILSVRLDGLSPTAKLINGFGYIEKDDRAVTDIQDVKSGDKINITIKNGRIQTVVENVSEDIYG
ncbi:MAG: exodeoxyribonuclease VII large subunit [Lachnospiraceae bacterium]|nr:exodeoxyribonuclease VII large subunit [Lachnospiraceae bacterium]